MNRKHERAPEELDANGFELPDAPANPDFETLPFGAIGTSADAIAFRFANGIFLRERRDADALYRREIAERAAIDRQRNRTKTLTFAFRYGCDLSESQRTRSDRPNHAPVRSTRR